MEYILAISICVNIALGYACYNLYRKNIGYEEIIITINNKIVEVIQRMRAIDLKGAFEADDEVGHTFKGLLRIVNELGEIIDVGEEKEEE